MATDQAEFEPLRSTKYDEEVQEQVFEALKEGRSQRSIADDVEPTRQTISKWAEKWGLKSDDGSGGESDYTASEGEEEQAAATDSAEGGGPPGELNQTATPTPENGANGHQDSRPTFSLSPGGESDTDDTPFADMSAGEFIEWFFEEDLSENAEIEQVSMFARRCEKRRALPTQAEMRNILDGLNSGVGNDTMIDWIAEDYWMTAKEYISAKLGIPEQQVEHAQQGGSWLEIGQSNRDRSGGFGNQSQPQSNGTVSLQQQQQGQQQPGGEVSLGGGQNAQQQQGGTVNPAMAGTQAPQPDTGNSVLDRLIEQQNTLMRQIVSLKDGDTDQQQQQMARELEQQLQHLQSQITEVKKDTDDEGTVEQLEKLAEQKETLENLFGDDDTRDAEIEQLRREFRSVVEQMNESGDESPELPLSNLDSDAALMVSMLQQDDVNSDVAPALIEAMNAQDPDVEAERVKMERELKLEDKRQEKWDSAVDALSETAQGLMEMLSDGDLPLEDLLGNNTRRQQPRQPQPGQPQQPRQPRQPRQEPVARGRENPQQNRVRAAEPAGRQSDPQPDPQQSGDDIQTSELHTSQDAESATLESNAMDRIMEDESQEQAETEAEDEDNGGDE